MKTRADKIQEEAIKKFGRDRVLKGVTINYINPAALVGVAIAFAVVIIGVMYAGKPDAHSTYTINNDQ